MVSPATPVFLAPKYIILAKKALVCRIDAVDAHRWRRLWVLFWVLTGRERAAGAGVTLGSLIHPCVLTRPRTAQEIHDYVSACGISLCENILCCVAFWIFSEDRKLTGCFEGRGRAERAALPANTKMVMAVAWARWTWWNGPDRGRELR